MIVYFVRHGSTEAVEKRLNQGINVPLSDKGIKQAKLIAKRFSDTKVDLIISSNYPRAIQTAKEMSSDILSSPLLAEFKKPSKIIGNPKDSVETKIINQKIRTMYLQDPTWHFSDEENFEDLKKRGLKALEFIESQNNENIVVVSHENIITLIVALMIFREEYSPELYFKIRDFLIMNNTGVTICVYEDNKWKLHCWNDISHCLE